MGSQIPPGGHALRHPEPELLTSYVDGRATPKERQRIEDHLTVCESCREAVAEQFAIVALLGGLNDEPAPRSFRLGAEFRRPGTDGAKAHHQPGNAGIDHSR